MIAYTVLMEPEFASLDIRLFVTMGSPLGIDEVQDFLKDHTKQTKLAVPPNVQRWINVCDPLDPVALDKNHQGRLQGQRPWGERSRTYWSSTPIRRGTPTPEPDTSRWTKCVSRCARPWTRRSSSRCRASRSPRTSFAAIERQPAGRAASRARAARGLRDDGDEPGDALARSTTSCEATDDFDDAGEARSPRSCTGTSR